MWIVDDGDDEDDDDGDHDHEEYDHEEYDHDHYYTLGYNSYCTTNNYNN